MTTYKIYIKLDDDNKKYVYLNDNKYFEIDEQLYHGYRRNHVPDLCKQLSETLNREVSSRELSNCLILGSISTDVE